MLGKFTISTGPFSIAMLNYQRVSGQQLHFAVICGTTLLIYVLYKQFPGFCCHFLRSKWDAYPSRVPEFLNIKDIQR